MSVKPIVHTVEINSIIEMMSNEICTDVIDPDSIRTNLKECDIYMYTKDENENVLGFATMILGKDVLYLTSICANKKPKGSGKALFEEIKKVTAKYKLKGIILDAYFEAKGAYKSWGFYEVDTTHCGSTKDWRDFIANNIIKRENLVNPNFPAKCTILWKPSLMRKWVLLKNLQGVMVALHHN